MRRTIETYIKDMSKKFAERNKLNLSEVNKEVLKTWDDEDVFHRSVTEREGAPHLSSSKVPQVLTDIPVFITCWHAVLRILSAAIRP